MIIMFLRTESLKVYIRLYPVISLILLINIILFAAMEVLGSSTSNSTLLQFGAMFKVPYVGLEPEPWRYVSSMFLHIGFMHLLMNGFSLYVFAAPLERMLGIWRFALLYLVSGIVGNIASYLLQQDSYVGAGASGGIYGIFAAYLYLSLFYKHVMNNESKTTIKTILIVGIIYSIAVPQVDLYAHVGGFVGGWIMTVIFGFTAKLRRR